MLAYGQQRNDAVRLPRLGKLLESVGRVLAKMQYDLWIFCTKGGQHGREKMRTAELRQPNRHITCCAAHAVVHLLMERFVKCDDAARCFKIQPADGGWCEACAAAVEKRCPDLLFLGGKHL